MQIHHLQGYIQSIYLVEYDHGLFLLDGCCRPDITLISNFITNDLNRPLTDLKLVFVSHMHPDHAGAAHLLRKVTGCTIASANKNKDWYSGVDGLLMFITDLLLTLWVAGKKGQQRKNIWYSPFLKPDYKLNDGDALPGFSEWNVLETPGHTDRDLSVIHLPTKRIYIGDLIIKIRNKLAPPFPIFHPNKYKESIAKIQRLEPNSLILAHGGEIELSSIEFEEILMASPKRPNTHWRSTKYHLRQMLQRG